MKSKTKLFLIFSCILSVIGAAYAVNAAPLNYTADTTVLLSNPSISLTIAAGSTASTTQINAGNIVVGIDAGNKFTVNSATRKLDVTGYSANALVSIQCSVQGVQTVSVEATTQEEAVTITPKVDVCGFQFGGGPDSGGSSYVAAVTAAATTTATTTPTTSITIPSLSANPTLSQIQSVLAAVTNQVLYIQVNLTASNAATLLAEVQRRVTELQSALGGQAVVVSQGMKPPAGSFKNPLWLGLRNPDVTALQNFLKLQGSEIYPEGIVSGYFGALTQKAVQRFQEKYGLAAPGIPGYGFVGPKTRAKINEILGL